MRDLNTQEMATIAGGDANYAKIIETTYGGFINIEDVTQTQFPNSGLGATSGVYMQVMTSGAVVRGKILGLIPVTINVSDSGHSRIDSIFL
jgi:hypothetical protein